MKKIGIGEAVAKVILIGEHAVVYGQPAMAIPFKALKTIVSISRTSDFITIDCKYYKGYLTEADKTIEGVKKLVLHILEKIDEEAFGMHIQIESSILSQRGMGSSAAVSVAVIRAMYDYFERPLEQEVLIDLAMYAERIYHENPSGLDVYTIVTQKPIWFKKPNILEVLDIHLQGTLIVFDSKKPSQTIDAVKHVQKLMKEEETTKEIIKEIGNLSHQARKALVEKNLSELGNLFISAHQYLIALGLSIKQFEEMISKLKQTACLGYKMTGGGMGGCMIALYHDETYVETVFKENDSIWKIKLEGI